MNPPQLGRPRFIVVDEALAWHAIAVAQYGGDPSLRDRGLLESALAQSRQAYGGEFAHGYPFGMAAAYAYHIAMNHPFIDGNKRTALMCVGAFLRMNGWDLSSTGTDAADALLSLIAGDLDKDSFAAWLEDHCKPRPSMEMRDFFALFTPGSDRDFIEASGAGRGPEHLASYLEAAQAMPVIHHLMERATQLKDEGNEIASVAFASRVQLLVAIYRIAEDMGYDW